MQVASKDDVIKGEMRLSLCCSITHTLPKMDQNDDSLAAAVRCRKELKLTAGSAFRFHFDGDSMAALCYDLKVNNEEAYVCSVGTTQT